MSATKGLMYIVCLASLLAGAAIDADPIEPGLDLYKTNKGQFSKLTLKKLKGKDLGTNPLVIPLKGKPFKNNPFAANPLPKGSGGNTDTIIKRTGTAVPSGKKGAFSVELVALSLKSKNPVKVDKGSTSKFFDVFVTLDPNTKSSGRKKIKSHEGRVDGNLFNLFLSTFLRVDFVPIGSTGVKPFQEFPDDHGSQTPSAATGFSHEPPPFYPTIPNQPVGNFFANSFNFNGGALVLSLSTAQVTEPLTLALVGTGLVLVGLGRRRPSPTTG